MGTIGTTQEGADTGTIRALALISKRAGCDLHHIGDAGFLGPLIPRTSCNYPSPSEASAIPITEWPSQ